MKTGDIIIKLFCLVLLLGAISSIVLLVFKLQNRDTYRHFSRKRSKKGEKLLIEHEKTGSGDANMAKHFFLDEELRLPNNVGRKRRRWYKTKSGRWKYRP